MNRRLMNVSWMLVIVPLVSACGAAVDGSEEESYDTEPTSPTASDRSVEEIRAQNDAAEQAAGLMLTLDVAEGHQVKFFRPGDGALMMTEQAPIGTPFVMTEPGMTPTAVFEMLNPGAAVPEVLEEFNRGQYAPGETDSPVDVSGHIDAPRLLVDKHATSSGYHFESEHLMCPHGLWERYDYYPAYSRHCLLNVGGWGAEWASVTHSQMFIGAYGGNVSFKYLYEGTVLQNITVLHGENRFIAAWSARDSNDKFLNRVHRYEHNGPAYHGGVAFVRAPNARGGLSARVVW